MENFIWQKANGCVCWGELGVGVVHDAGAAERHWVEHGLRAVHALAPQGHPPARAAQARARGQKAVNICACLPDRVAVPTRWAAPAPAHRLKGKVDIRDRRDGCDRIFTYHVHVLITLLTR